MTKISGPRLLKAAMLASATVLFFAVPTQSIGLGSSPRAPALAAAADASDTAPAVSKEMKRGKLPRGARYMTGQELFELYVGKTWRWGEGGGYFGAKGMFRARTYDATGVTDGGGTWGVNDKGRMCFRAVWTAASGVAKANTCFDHVLLEGNIYQRRTPDGAWYVFRHATPKDNDEYAKLVRGNLVSGMVRH